MTGVDLERRMAESSYRLTRSVLHCRVPVVAAVHGACAGIGLTLALGADVPASRPTTPAPPPRSSWRGLVPDGAIARLLPRHRSRKAREFLLLGQSIEAAEAVRIGMIAQRVPVAELADSALATAREFAALRTDAIAYTKQLLNRSFELDLESFLFESAPIQALLKRGPVMEGGPIAPDTPPARRARRRADIVDCDLTSGAAFLPACRTTRSTRSVGTAGSRGTTSRRSAGLMGDNPMLQFVDSPGFWVVTSYDLVYEVDRDQERFSSELGGTSMPSMAEDSLPIFRQMMLNMDHPQHTRLRRILQPGVHAAGRSPSCAGRSRSNAADIVDGVARRGRPRRRSWRPRCRSGCWPTCSACPARTATSSSSGATR